MKKRKIITASFLLPLSALALASCAKDSKNEDIYIPSYSYGKWGAKQVEQNLEKNQVAKPDLHISNILSANMLDSYVIEDNSYASLGIILVSEGSFTCIYNKNLQRFIAAYDDSGVSIKATSYDGNIVLIEVRKSHNLSVMDQFGNELYENPDGNFLGDSDYSIYNAKVTNYNNTTYIRFKNNFVYKYDRQTPLKVDSDFLTKDEQLAVYGYILPVKGEQFLADKVVLDCGYEDYYMQNIPDSYLAARKFNFYQSGKFTTSITIGEYDPYFFIGKSLVVQKIIELDEHEEDYDYYESGTKYKLVTTVYDIKTGASKNIKTSLVLIDAEAYKFNSDKVYDTAVVNVKQINKNKIIECNRTLILDSNLKSLADVTGLEVFDFVKSDATHYFNTSTNLIYDDKMNIVLNGELDDYTYGVTKRDDKDEYFFVASYRDKLTGKYGVIGGNGEYLLKDQFDTVYLYDNTPIIKALGEEKYFYNCDGSLVDKYTSQSIHTYDDLNVIVDDNGITFKQCATTLTYDYMTSLGVSSLAGYAVNISLGIRKYQIANIKTVYQVYITNGSNNMVVVIESES